MVQRFIALPAACNLVRGLLHMHGGYLWWHRAGRLLQLHQLVEVGAEELSTARHLAAGERGDEHVAGVFEHQRLEAVCHQHRSVRVAVSIHLGRGCRRVGLSLGGELAHFASKGRSTLPHAVACWPRQRLQCVLGRGGGGRGDQTEAVRRRWMPVPRPAASEAVATQLIPRGGVRAVGHSIPHQPDPASTPHSSHSSRQPLIHRDADGGWLRERHAMPGWSARRGEVHVAGRGGQTRRSANDAEIDEERSGAGADISPGGQGRGGGRRKAAAKSERSRRGDGIQCLAAR